MPARTSARATDVHTRRSQMVSPADPARERGTHQQGVLPGLRGTQRRPGSRLDEGAGLLVLTVTAEVAVILTAQRRLRGTAAEHKLTTRGWALSLTRADRLVYPLGLHVASQRCLIP